MLFQEELACLRVTETPRESELSFVENLQLTYNNHIFLGGLQYILK